MLQKAGELLTRAGGEAFGINCRLFEISLFIVSLVYSFLIIFIQQPDLLYLLPFFHQPSPAANDTHQLVHCCCSLFTNMPAAACVSFLRAPEETPIPSQKCQLRSSGSKFLQLSHRVAEEAPNTQMYIVFLVYSCSLMSQLVMCVRLLSKGLGRRHRSLITTCCKRGREKKALN